MPKEWVALLRGVTIGQIKDGLNRVAEIGSDFPPNGASFKNLCLGIKVDRHGNDISTQHKSAAYKTFQPEKRIEDKTYVSKREKAAKRELGNMKDMFR